MKQGLKNTDGFFVRRRSNASQAGRPTLDSHNHELKTPTHLGGDQPIKPAHQPPMVVRRKAISADPALATDQPSMVFDGIDIDLKEQPSKSKPIDKPRRKWPIRKIIKWSLIGLLILVLAAGGYFAYKFISTGGQIFKGNLINAVFAPAKRLATDANGRSNLLLFGTSEDDPGHEAADLTDSMMLVSVNQDTKEAFLISIPRDLYVDFGRACPAGYQGKLNSLYSCVKQDKGEEAGQEALRAKIGSIFGLDVQYSTHVNYAALREAVDAVGGITVNIDSSDSRGILDRNFDWDCPKGLYTCFNVKYPNGPANLNGKQALYLARARGANGDTYGLKNANFEREKYQREILIALKDKAVSVGTLANPVVVNNLLTTIGSNVRTNFTVEEVKTLVSLAQEVKSENVATLQLNDPDKLLVTTGNVNGQSIVKPTKGLYDYSDIKATVKLYASGDRAQIEKAVIDVFNVSGTAGLGQTKADLIEDENLIIGKVANGPAALNTEPLQVYDLSDKSKPATRQKLEKLLGVTIKDEPKGGITGISSSADFVVIIGTPSSQ